MYNTNIKKREKNNSIILIQKADETL